MAYGSQLVLGVAAFAVVAGCGASKTSSSTAGGSGPESGGDAGESSEVGGGSKGGSAGSSGSNGGAAQATGGGSAGGPFTGGSAGRSGSGAASTGTTAGNGMGAAGAVGTSGSGSSGLAGMGSAGMSSAGSAGSGFGHTRSDRAVYVAGATEVRAYAFERTTGEFKAYDDTPDLGPNPSYLGLSLERSTLVVANDDDGDAGGLTTATIDASGHLAKVDHQTGSDGGFAHVYVNSQTAVGASYAGGSVSKFFLSQEGVLFEEDARYDFGGGAETSGIAFDGVSGVHMFVANQGKDEIAQLYLSDQDFIPNSPETVLVPQGSGPRHLASDPDGSFIFSINERNSTLTAFKHSGAGTLIPGATVSTVPSDFAGQNAGAHVEVSPNRVVYASNCGHDSIVAFALDQTSGELTLLEHVPSGGEDPLDFDIDIKGEFMIVANQGDSQVVAFHIELDGTLTPLGSVEGPEGARAVQIRYQP